jgi:hypothetical protein
MDPTKSDNVVTDTAGDTGLEAANDPRFQQMILGGDIPDNPAGTIEQGAIDESYRRESLEQGLVQPTTEEVATDAEGEGLPEEAEEAKEVDIDTPVENAVEPGSAEEAEITRRQLTDEDLDNTFMKRIINGKEELVSLREVRDGYQIKEAGLERLDLAKEAQRQYQELATQYQQELERIRQTPPEPVLDEYATQEEKDLAAMQAKLQNLEHTILSEQQQRLSAQEDAEIRTIIRDQLGTEDMNQAALMIQRIKAEDPAYGAIADELFNRQPSDLNDMHKRVAFFKSLAIRGAQLEMPTIIENAKEEGKRDLIREKKSKLASVETTQKPPEESRGDKISKAARRGDRGMAKLGEELFVKGLFPELNS